MMRKILAGFAGFLLMASANSASVDGIGLYSIDIGQGPAVVFVHGGYANMSNWDAQIGAFAQDYRVLALDLPGHGMSESPRDRNLSFELWARAVEAIREEADVDKIVLVGHSMGVGVIRNYVHLFPEHVAALVAVDASLVEAPRGASSPDESSPSERPARPTRESVEMMLRERFFVPETPIGIEVRVLEMMAPRILNAPMDFDAIFGANIIPDSPQIIEVPVLHIWAGSSLLTGDIGAPDNFPEVFPNSSFEAIPGTGHFLMMEKPEEFNRLLSEFLEEIDAVRSGWW